MSKLEGATMLLINSVWNEKKTFKMIPVTLDCPYVEGFYDPESKVFVIIGKTMKTTMHMIPKLNDEGKPVIIKGGKSVKQERKAIETFTEYYIENKEDIKTVVELMAFNASEFDYLSHLTEVQVVQTLEAVKS